MQLGIFARTFQRSSPDQLLEAIAALGIRDVHYNLACCGLGALPERITVAECRAIRRSFAQHGLAMCGLSGTCNLIHPDAAVRRDLVRRLGRLIAACPDLGTGLISLCTGTRDASDPWKHHPDNRQPAAWDDLCASLQQLLPLAERHGIQLGIEPEQGNVIHSATAARRLMNQFASPGLKIVMDAANLFHEGNLAAMPSVLDEAFELLGDSIAVAHAKDIPRTCGSSQAAGMGQLDWSYYIACLTKSGFRGSLVLHNLSETEVPQSLAFVRGLLAAGPAQRSDPAEDMTINPDTAHG